ncbi:tRNA (34-2'-O)-methyltransferase regulator WDR6 [Gouania willdenowi]|uniref:tRNA (34-2'-O)-methyltransferase regulator WDR6 n=1 Tax=Gouania willdenowi TaxID=441366 RepID=UPI001055AA04|nr:WD repeat-containing protein 6 [Gouania willdenowi]
METSALLVPVTCLEFLEDKFLLSGEGPVVTVFSLTSGSKACQTLSVLQHHTIHGIRSRRKRTEAQGVCPTFYDLAVFGGKAVILVRFYPQLQDGKNPEPLSPLVEPLGPLVEPLGPLVEPLGPLTELQDWVLDVRWLSEPNQSLLCVAVAHNRVLLLDVLTGQTLVQSSCSEGCLLYSALLLVHKSWESTVVVGGTVFNQLVVWRPGGGGGGDKAPVEHRLLGHRGVIFSISYSDDEGYLASASDDRSVRVWKVGTLGGPPCGEHADPTPACLLVLYGHQARVFSVRLSLGRVFSAGEDGACLVWDLTRNGRVIRTLKGHRAGGVRALAVSEGGGSDRKWVATGGADGGLRLWRVEGGAGPSEEPVTDKLSDLRFCGDGVPKVVTISRGGGTTCWTQTGFVVCTDKGHVYQYWGGAWQIIWRGPSEFQSYCVMQTVVCRGRGSAAEVELCAVGNLSGSVQLFPTAHPNTGVRLSAGSGKIHSLIWTKGNEHVYLLVSGSEGLVHRWGVTVEMNENGGVDLQVGSVSPFCLPPCAKRWLTAAVQLHTHTHTLWLCGDRRGSLLLFQENKRQNKDMKEEQKPTMCETELNHFGLEFQRMQVDDAVLHPISCVFGVHGKQGVTSVCEHQGLIYSTGRDGCVRVLRVHKCENSDSEVELQVLRVQRACRGMEWLERILILQREEEELLFQVSATFNEKRSGKEARFVIVGFHGVHFVVWDPVKQERLFSVPCGGGHRSWGLWPHNDHGLWPGYAALVFIKQGSVVVSQPPRDAPGQGGGAELETCSGRVLREGVHGRGIGCVCRVGRIRKPGDEGHWDVMVTGGDDTSLCVIAFNSFSGNMKVLSVITDHISSVRCITAIVRPQTGSESHSALVVSAGGRAQIECYQLLITWDTHTVAPSCQVIQVASHRLDAQWERRRNRHKMVKMDPETRYMSIAVVEQRTDRVLLALSCSDGAVRLFSVNEVKGQMDLLWESFYHQRCVLSVASCCLEDHKSNKYTLLFSAATDGKIAVWHLTEASLSMIDDSLSTTTTPPPIPCLDIPAHQSGVNSLAVWTEKLGQVDGCQVTVASGGDDGQLTVSTLRVQSDRHGNKEFNHIPKLSTLIESDLEERSSFSLSLQYQTHVLLAHAAPLTALKLLRPRLLVSTSSDQRVSLWNVCSTGISHRSALCSHVADAAGLDVWAGAGRGVGTRTQSVLKFSSQVEPRGETEGENTEREGGACDPVTGWVLVCGQGLQLLRVNNVETDDDDDDDELGMKKGAKVKVERLI